jgi:hypothetical protein
MLGKEKGERMKEKGTNGSKERGFDFVWNKKRNNSRLA